MKREPLIISGPPSRIGDCIVSLPFLTYLKKEFPDSFICRYIDRTCSQIAPLFLNQDNIDKIYISEETDKVSDKEKQMFLSYDLVFDPYPPVTDSLYFNTRHIIHEEFLMQRLWHMQESRIDPSEWDKLTEDERKPRLHAWFDIERRPKTVCIFPSAGYNNKDKTIDLRSPSDTFWWKLENLLFKAGYETIRLGIKEKPNLSLFETVRLALGCDFSISTDSGISWVLNAYGANNLTLFTNYKPEHTSNFDAFLPINWRGNMISFFGRDKNINNISHEEVMQAIKNFK